ncbi:NADH-quinone oxidoreductase subunit L [Parageobacillus caldoxylosilyticus]|uniref:Probable inorganic carbon transporter subunit DabB n=2 Tax=Saccharococcus caldoxylosilyticus TaxID=81408 RepID=A0A023DJ92_9BACL|nr:NADH-quinone oxidoreductase subunit L [Parageobacillus caldoxylosilyticus]BDG35818.1 putative NADH-quinone oxidoreductase subunit 5 [Parageobacillus caldoxylosilyticus]BDG39600.1 putative NADH-quinone oxidoreductase subunit 5 [Parageobacillus caldoxylosilyticus]BDG43374.1 putative NADH-quinone oxidoreductase subunit 5 [Parageobacillus caldoxylosilyticus]GAJ41303.1 NADH-quinone oxidoreductase subunit F [Parageobacillus caldoxylosilyticus NBRC 107762]
MSETMFITLFATLAVTLISSVFLLHPRIPVRYVRIHVSLLVLPIAVALAGLVGADKNVAIGPWRSDMLAWLMALYIFMFGWMIQRFCIRYLHGDRAYRMYFMLLTFTVSAASITWMSDDLRLLVLCWGMPLLGLTLLAMQKKEWQPVRVTVMQMARMFLLSWIALLAAAIWLWQATGYWRLSFALSKESIAGLEWWEADGVNVLLVLAAIIPAGQWPFQRWLLESTVTPTPISAVMHAGLVNAGGLLLTRFSPLFSGNGSQMLLLMIASVSVLIGTGISLVQVDYKRQLVASTMAQMGMMFIQCALSAYAAAVIHLVLHGLFKATLFLQSGSVVPRPHKMFRPSLTLSKAWLLGGAIFGFALGLVFWMTSPEENTRLLSALLLGWSLAFAWGRLAVLKEGRWIGVAVLAGLALASEVMHSGLMALLYKTLPPSSSTSMITEMAAVLMFGLGGLASIWFSVHRSSDSFAYLYMWLVHIGEPRSESVEGHPHYLVTYLQEEGVVDEQGNRIA